MGQQFESSNEISVQPGDVQAGAIVDWIDIVRNDDSGDKTTSSSTSNSALDLNGADMQKELDTALAVNVAKIAKSDTASKDDSGDTLSFESSSQDNGYFTFGDTEVGQFDKELPGADNSSGNLDVDESSEIDDTTDKPEAEETTEKPENTEAELTWTGDPPSGKEQPLDNGKLYVDEQTGFTIGIRYTEGQRAGQEYQFSRDAMGNVTEMTIKVNGTSEEAAQEIKLTKGEDGWQVVPPEARNKIPEFENLKFKDSESGTAILKGDITVTENGTIQYERGDGIKEVIRPEGIHDVYDLNEYSRVREVDGQSTKLYWDGYNWRAGDKDPDNANAVLFNPPVEGKPTRIVRDGENDTLKVEFGDGLTYDADWKNQKMTRSGGNLPDVTLYPTSHVDSDGDPYWMAGEEKQGPDGSVRIEFKASNDEEQVKMSSGELPVEAVVPGDSDQVTVKYANGSEITASRKGEVREIEHANGQKVQITRDISGRVVRIENLGGRTYERQGSRSDINQSDLPGQNEKGQKTTQWNVTENGEQVSTFDGEVNVGLNGSIDLESSNGNKVNLDNNGRLVTTIDGKAVKAVDAQGQIWERLSDTENGSEKPRWKVSSNGEEKVLNGELKLLDNGAIAVETAEGNLESINKDGSEWKPPGDKLPFPPRQPGSELAGSAFFRDILGADPAAGKYNIGLTGAAREQAILKQIEAGNIPDFLREPKKVVLQDGNGNTAELSVMPDYLAIGTNEDWVRVPITPVLARAIADRYGLELPTEKVADAIYNQADRKLTVKGLWQSSRDDTYMVGNGFYLQHNKDIESQLGDTPDGALVAGHKKDIIYSNFAARNPSKLDYYGFFDGNGKAIQNSGGGAHGNTYVDYSHGVRFIGETVVVNGQPMRYADVLRNPQLAGLLSNQGTLDVDSIYRRSIPGDYQVLF